MKRSKKKSASAPSSSLAKSDGTIVPDKMHGDVKRSMAAIFLFVVAVLCVLGFFDAAGPLGRALNYGGSLALGWGKWMAPFVITIAGVFLLQKKHSTLADTLKFLGLIFSFVSLLGLSHLYGPDFPLAAAQDGEGGGFAGYALALLAEYAAGPVAGGIILAAFLFIGLIAAFNVSLIRWLERLRERLSQTQDADVLVSDNPDSPDSPDHSAEKAAGTVPAAPATETLAASALPLISASSSQESEMAAANIRSIRFSEKEPLMKTAPDIPAPVVQSNDNTLAPLALTEPAFQRSHPVQKPRLAEHRWQLPPLHLVEESTEVSGAHDTEENTRIIQETLRHFGVIVEPGGVQVGPTVTQYTFKPAVGVKLSRITTLHNDLTLALAAPSIRIEAPIPGKSLIGIEVPNQSMSSVRMRNLLKHELFRVNRPSSLTLALGADVSGSLAFTDLEKLPHLLIAGVTYSGKSICIHAILISLLYQNTPDTLRLILIDPKRTELSLYLGLPHLRAPVVIDSKKVITVLRWAANEMDRRNKLLHDSASQNINSYLEKMRNGYTREVTTRGGTKRPEPLESLPYIVIVVDELADLMMQYGKEVEPLLVRLVQVGRAVGIHLILATQKPVAQVVTGLLKGNIAARIAFKTGSLMDSRIILDHNGAERLLGRGDMLYLSPSASQPKRLQGVFVTEGEIKAVTDFWRRQKRDMEDEEGIGDMLVPPETQTPVTQSDRVSSVAHVPRDASPIDPSPFGLTESGSAPLDLDAPEPDLPPEEKDALYAEAKQVVIQSDKASASLLQRRLSVGYARAARLIDLLEEYGVVGPGDGAKPRAILLHVDDSRRDPQSQDAPLDQVK